MNFTWTYYFLIFLLFKISNISQAQRTYELDLVGGITSSQISGDGLAGFSQFGLHLGGLINSELNDHWELNFGLIWNQKGARSYQSFPSLIVYRLRANYIEIPLLFRYKINYDDLDYFFVEAGISVNRLAHYRERTSAESITDRPFRNFELSGVGNIGYQFMDEWALVIQFQNSILPVRPHLVDMALPPANIILGDIHRRLYELGQYYTTLSLQVRYRPWG